MSRLDEQRRPETPYPIARQHRSFSHTCHAGQSPRGVVKCTIATYGYFSMRSRMTRISASRFGAHTSCIRDIEVGGSGDDNDERLTLRASAGEDGGGNGPTDGDHFQALLPCL
jgi:hypothetical protein